jgi:hypothetical protein
VACLSERGLRSVGELVGSAEPRQVQAARPPHRDRTRQAAGKHETGLSLRVGYFPLPGYRLASIVDNSSSRCSLSTGGIVGPILSKNSPCDSTSAFH